MIFDDRKLEGRAGGIIHFLIQLIPTIFQMARCDCMVEQQAPRAAEKQKLWDLSNYECLEPLGWVFQILPGLPVDVP